MSDIVIYSAEDGHIELDVNLVDDTVWLSMNQMAELFGRDKSVISRHLNNIFETNELDRPSAVAYFATVQKEGKREIQRKIEYFNLDAIISVGYRVNSKQGIQFRRWASEVLKEHLIRGYTVYEKRLSEKGVDELFEKCSEKNNLKKQIKEYAKESIRMLIKDLNSDGLDDDHFCRKFLAEKNAIFQGIAVEFRKIIKDRDHAKLLEKYNGKLTVLSIMAKTFGFEEGKAFLKFVASLSNKKRVQQELREAVLKYLPGQLVAIINTESVQDKSASHSQPVHAPADYLYDANPTSS